MYHIHHTEGFLLGSRPAGRASRHLVIFTRDLGLVVGRAQAVRELSSKLRFHLQDFSYSRLSLVRGKSGWRVTGAEVLVNLYNELRNDEGKLAVCLRVLNLLKKLCPPEEKDAVLFDIVSSAALFLRSENLAAADLAALEIILVLRILHRLGYLGVTLELLRFVEPSTDWRLDALSLAPPLRRDAVSRINRALEASQLVG